MTSAKENYGQKNNKAIPVIRSEIYSEKKWPPDISSFQIAKAKWKQFIRFKFFIRKNLIYSVISPVDIQKEIWVFSSSFLYNPPVWSIGIIPNYSSVRQFCLIQNDVTEGSSNRVVWLKLKASFRVWREMDQLPCPHVFLPNIIYGNLERKELNSVISGKRLWRA